MSYTDSLKDTLQALQFDADGIKQILSNPDAVSFGLITAVVAGIAQAIGTFSIFGLFFIPITTVVGLAVVTGISHLLAKLFGGQGSYRDLFAVMSNATLAYWVTVVPGLGFVLSPLIALFLLVFSVFALKEVYSLSILKSIAILLLPGVVLTLLLVILAFAFLGGVASLFSLGALASAA